MNGKIPESLIPLNQAVLLASKLREELAYCLLRAKVMVEMELSKKLEEGADVNEKSRADGRD